MPSKAAKTALLGGRSRWESFRKNNEGQRIDLSFVEVPDNTDLRGLDFSNCDLTGAKLCGCSFDGSVFVGSILHGGVLDDTSLVACKFEAQIIKEASFHHAIIRNTLFKGITFHSVDFTGATFDNCTFRACQFLQCKFGHSVEFLKSMFVNSEFARCDFTSARLRSCEFEQARIERFFLHDSKLTQCGFEQSEIENFKMDEGIFDRVAFRGSVVRNMVLQNVSVRRIDLSNSFVVGINVSQINPADAILLNTAFVGCQWPEQSGTVSVGGKYMPSPYLIAQPVQDVRGINPLLRREIADAQFLVNLIQSKNNGWEKALIRLWGITTAFGQSIMRLTLFSISVIVLLSFVLLLTENGFALFTQQAAMNIPNALLPYLKLEISIFFGLDSPTVELLGHTIAKNIVFMSTRVLGFIVLGLWMTIAANKVVNLSSG